MNIKQSDSYQVAAQIAWQPAGEGVRRQVMAYDERLMLVKVEFKKGAVGAAHTHPHSQASYVASGKFELTIGGESKTLSEGDGYYVAPDVLHGCKCLEAGILIDTFSPLREDFIA